VSSVEVGGSREGSVAIVSVGVGVLARGGGPSSAVSIASIMSEVRVVERGPLGTCERVASMRVRCLRMPLEGWALPLEERWGVTVFVIVGWNECDGKQKVAVIL
jgi:hypothetical protein